MGSGITQEDSFNPLLFSIVMDKIIKSVKQLKEYRLIGHYMCSELCRWCCMNTANQKILYSGWVFYMETRKRNTEMLTEKQSLMAVVNVPVWFKLELKGKMI